MNNIIEFEVKNFDLDHIFDCGQCFRFEPCTELKNSRESIRDNAYIGIAGGRVAFLTFEGKADFAGKLTIELLDNNNEALASTKEFWEEYLDLSRDYGKIKEEFSKRDEKLATAIKYGEGIRILKQEPFETIISFIISQNSNIPRIKKCINVISEKYGKFLGEYNGDKYYAFPTISELSLATKEELMDLKLGYRADYIVKTVAQIQENLAEFERLPELDYSQARDYLLGLTGIGPKVADCILLFGLSRVEAFPIDVWVKRVMHEVYGFKENDLKGMKAFASENFGKFGGIAQQYLFYYIRQV